MKSDSRITLPGYERSLTPSFRGIARLRDVVHDQDQLVVVIAVLDFDVDSGIGHTARDCAELARHFLLQSQDDHITLGKNPTLANKRLAFDRLRDRDIVVKLFDELGPRYKTRKGGYLRILKMGFRQGDNAPMAYVELVDRPTAAAATAE